MLRAVFEAEMEKRPQGINRKPRDTYEIRTARTTPLRTVPFSFLPLFSALVSVLVRSGLGFIVLVLQSSCLQKFMLGQSCPACCCLSCSASLLPVFTHETGGSAAADSDFRILC